MDTLAKADVFFFITSIAVGLFTVAGIIIAIFVIKVLRDLRVILQDVKHQTRQVSEDIDMVRQYLKSKKTRFWQRVQKLLQALMTRKSRVTQKEKL
jgi:uncharacterized protein YoxC